MPDILNNFLKYSVHEDLRKAYDLWEGSSRVRDKEEFKRSTGLMEVLARETRIWVFSKIVSEGSLPPNLEIPPIKTDFGKEVNFLEALHDRPVLKKLAVSSPDAGEGFVKLHDVFELIEGYLKASDDMRDEFKKRLDSLQPGAREAWLPVLRLFQRLRNLDGHDAAQANAKGIPAYVSDKLAPLVPSIVRAMRARIEWMILQAATQFGKYELRSKEVMHKDRDYSVRTLLNNNAFSLDSADYWYVLYVDDEDEARSAADVFPRLESGKQIASAVAGATESPESPMFESAKRGCFLPVIGPAFSSPDDADSPGASDVVERARSVVGDDRFKEEQELSGFLARLLSDRLSLDIPDLKSGPAASSDTLRARLVGELALLALDATRAFGHSLAKWGTAFTGNGELLDDDDVQRLKTRIRDVRDFVRSLLTDRTTSDGDRTDLGLDAIAEGLRILAADEVSDKRLSVASVAWLGDLVWHALSWDTSLYPDSQALNVQLSLGMGGSSFRGGAALGRTLASSGTALSIGSTELEEYVAAWSQRREKRVIKRSVRTYKGKEWQDPYEVVAKALSLCLKVRQRLKPDRTPPDLEGAGDRECRIEARNAVFVVDATFDQRMCEALTKIGAKHAVVYPIDIEDNVQIKHPVWAMRRSPCPAKADLEYSVLWDGVGQAIDWQDVPRIVVIKPYGAPREPIEPLEQAVLRARKDTSFPIAADRQGDFFGITRRFLFDDVAILKDMVQKQDSMPPGFRHAIHDRSKRFELFFLGYSIEEHGRRARIVADVQPAGDDSQETRDKPLYLSQPSPTPAGFVHNYLERAGFKNQKRPLGRAMRDLALSVRQYELDGATP